MLTTTHRLSAEGGKKHETPSSPRTAKDKNETRK